jgi:hypothetical protein
MGNSQSIQKINFEDVQTAYKNPEVYLLINTISEIDQVCLIPNTIGILQEEMLINKYIRANKSVKIIIYGRNSNDETIYKKYNQLFGLGFTNVYVYIGGLFEWLLLQDIYGTDEFPTTTIQRDILKYKPSQKINVGLLENG